MQNDHPVFADNAENQSFSRQEQEKRSSAAINAEWSGGTHIKMKYRKKLSTPFNVRSVGNSFRHMETITASTVTGNAIEKRGLVNETISK